MVRTLASREQITESALVKQLLDVLLRRSAVGELLPAPEVPKRHSRLSVRLHRDDRLLLSERASARGMPAATYVSLLVRRHLRNATPLLTRELGLLNQATAELSSIGRNLNQIARAANQGGRVVGPRPEELRALLRVCEGLRDHVHQLIDANVRSWGSGDG
jgi:hypothetical protein